jgi:hypothetical protein
MPISSPQMNTMFGLAVGDVPGGREVAGAGWGACACAAEVRALTAMIEPLPRSIARLSMRPLSRALSFFMDFSP